MANAIESQAKHDAQAFKGSGDTSDHSKALQSVADHAHSMSTKDLKSEQQYWNSLGKASHDHLPGLTIHRNNDGNVDSVKNAAGESMYDRDAEVKKAVDSNTATLKNGQGPFDAFKAAGLSDREASEQAKKVMEATGRTSFHSGEKLGVHPDGTVTTSSTDRKTGIKTEDSYNKEHNEAAHEHKVTQKNGDSTTTYADKDGKVNQRVEHTKDPNTGVETDTKYDVDGDKSTRREKTVKDANGDTHTTEFKKDGTRYATKDVEEGGKKTTIKNYEDNGLDLRNKFVTDENKGTLTKTEYENGQRVHERTDKEAPGPDQYSFTDTTWKDGKQTEKIDRQNGPNGSYSETRDFTPGDPSQEIHRTKTRGETDPQTGKFSLDGVDVQGPQDVNKAHTNSYSMVMTDDKNGVGVRVKGGPSVADQNPHNVKMVDGEWVDLGKQK